MLDKIGIPKRLAWGFLGVVLFMMGDGLEQGWLSPFDRKRAHRSAVRFHF